MWSRIPSARYKKHRHRVDTDGMVKAWQLTFWDSRPIFAITSPSFRSVLAENAALSRSLMTWICSMVANFTSGLQRITNYLSQ